MTDNTKTGITVAVLCATFSVLAVGFLSDSGGAHVKQQVIPLVDTNFLDKSTTRRDYADLVKAGDDLSDFDCYACHDKKNPPPLRLDTNGNIIVAKEHPDIVMQHGWNGRNNNCYNCHNETNLTLLQPRNGQEVTFADSPKLCGSCHGPIYHDWQAGAHGRTSGYWDRSMGPIERKACVNCHNPHSPAFPSRKPAPGPHPLRELTAATAPSNDKE
jgi:uncharacterized CHY-type Zn-finger protein